MNKNSKHLSSVAMLAWSEARFVFIALAKKMKEEQNSLVHLYCNSDEQVAFYTGQNKEQIFSSINKSSGLLETVLDDPPPEDEVVKQAKYYEAKTGVSYNMLSVSNRHLGRGYALGGFHHPRSRYSELSSYIQMLHAYNKSFTFWEKEIEDKKLSLVIHGGKELAVLCRLNGIPFRFLCTSRYNNLHNWAWNEFLENPEFTHAYDAGIGAGDGVMDAPYSAYTANRKIYLPRAKVTNLIKNIGMKIAYHTWWRIKGYQKAKGYYLSEEIKFYYHVWRDWRRLSKLGLKLDEMKNKTFVYYPLHTEPETALQSVSPEFFYQLSLIAAISRDLPAGVFLVVKEHHAAVGRRPRDFYDQILEFKNVIMLDPFEVGFECIQHSSAVVTICGSSGLEAAAAGKPVIAFGRHNIYNVLPQVFAITDEAELKECLEKSLSDTFEKEAMSGEAKKFLKAVTACSFDMDQYDFLKLDDFSENSIDQAYGSLIQGLNYQDQLADASPYSLVVK